MKIPKIVLFSLLFLPIAITGRGAAPAKPNIILFLVDDMGWMDTTVNGSKYYETPNMERLARRAMRFTDAYVTPLCSSSRACILTGKTTLHTGVTAAAGHNPPKEQTLAAKAPPSARLIYPLSQSYLAPSEYTLAEALRAAGYRTGHFGKWHLGLTRPYWPEQQGFDVAFHQEPSPGPASYFSPYGVKPDGEPSTKNRVGTITDGPPGEYIADRLTDEALKFIESNRERPFFLNLWQYNVHAPWGFKKDYAEPFLSKKDPRGKQDNAIMGAMLRSTDESLGRILDKLDELKLTENTILIFLSDNGGIVHTIIPGPDGQKYGHGLTPTNNEPLRGGKAMLYEGGVRVPLMVSWPGVVKPGTTSQDIVHAYDLYPTILEALGLARHPEQKMDGISIMPALRQSGPLVRPGVFQYFPHTLFGIPPGVSVRTGDWKLIRWFETNEDYPEAQELYNLKDDIGETTNLASKLPDKLKQMEALIDGFLASGGIVPIPNPNFDPQAQLQAKAPRLKKRF